jgi:hypothetical protein
MAGVSGELVPLLPEARQQDPNMIEGGAMDQPNQASQPAETMTRFAELHGLRIRRNPDDFDVLGATRADTVCNMCGSEAIVKSWPKAMRARHCRLRIENSAL